MSVTVFPLITSKSVNPNVLPGVCKALEKYLIVYRQDAIMNKLGEKYNKEGKGKLKLKRGRFVLEQLVHEDNGDGKGPDDGTRISADEYRAEKEKREREKAEREKEKWELEKAEREKRELERQDEKRKKKDKRRRPAPIDTVKTYFPHGDALTVEPTWMHITTPDEGTQVLGVKVVPFIIDSDANLLQLLKDDKSRKKLSVVVQRHVRRLLVVMYKIADYTWAKTLGLFAFTGLIGKKVTGGTISGDWKKDIILGLTSFKRDMFVLLNQLDLEDDFLKSAGSINKLFGLSWPSVIIANDVDKRVSFCMRPFRGMCSTVSYQFLYSSVDRQTAQAFETIEDVRRAAGTLFRTSGRRFKDMLKDSTAVEKLFDYSKLNMVLESLVYEGEIPPNFQKIVKAKLKDQKKFKSSLEGVHAASKSKNFKELHKRLNNLKLPRMNMDQAKRAAERTNPSFKSNLLYANKVLENSLPGIPKQACSAAAAAIAMKASMSTKDQKTLLKNSLKEVILKTRAAQKTDTSWDKEVLFAFVFAVTFVVLAGVVAHTLIVKGLPLIFSSIETFFAYVLVVIFLMIVANLIVALKGGAEEGA